MHARISPDKVSDVDELGEIAAAMAVLNLLFPLDLTGCDPVEPRIV